MIEEKLEPIFKKLNVTYNVHARIYSEKRGLDYTYFHDGQEKPFHIASVGKMFTTVIGFMLIEEGKLRLDDKISKYLPADLLKGLFIYKGTDYADTVTLQNLMGHTSGVVDYFDKKYEKFAKDIVKSPDKFWTPEAAIDTVRGISAAGKPGECFCYSDTGYNLLGMVIERAAEKEYHDVLHERILSPIGMDDSYLMYRSEPKNGLKPIETIWWAGNEVSTNKGLSIDWCGGGIISTVSDLLKFNLALHGGKLITRQNLEAMQKASNKYRAGMFYGLGMVIVDFGGFSFFLKNYPKLYGHLGVFTVHLYYDPISETHIVLNYGNTDAMRKSFNALIKIGSLIK